jgi:hypothetical protein
VRCHAACDIALHVDCGAGSHSVCEAVLVVCVLQDLWAWMQQNHIVERLLRTGLHHKQYMVEVGAFGRCMCVDSMLAPSVLLQSFVKSRTVQCSDRTACRMQQQAYLPVPSRGYEGCGHDPGCVCVHAGDWCDGEADRDVRADG